MPTLQDYPEVSRIQSQSPALRCGWPKLLDKRKFWSVAHKKLRFKLHMFQNSKIIWLLMLVLWFLASFSCVMHVVVNKKKRVFLCYPYLSKSLIGWVLNQLKSQTARWGGGRWVGGPNQKRNFPGGSCIGKFGRVGQGAGPKKYLQICDLQRLASLQ